jgi:hypothetical protein
MTLASIQRFTAPRYVFIACHPARLKGNTTEEENSQGLSLKSSRKLLLGIGGVSASSSGGREQETGLKI